MKAKSVKKAVAKKAVVKKMETSAPMMKKGGTTKMGKGGSKKYC